VEGVLLKKLRRKPGEGKKSRGYRLDGSEKKVMDKKPIGDHVLGGQH